MAVRLEKETAERLEKTRAKFGEEGLRQLEEQLKKAQEQNDLDIPPEMLSSFKIPDVAGIRWIDVKTAGAGSNKAKFDNDVQRHLDQDKVDLPYFVQFEREYTSSFSERGLVVNTRPASLTSCNYCVISRRCPLKLHRGLRLF